MERQEPTNREGKKDVQGASGAANETRLIKRDVHPLSLQTPREDIDLPDLPPNFHPVPSRVVAKVTPSGAG